jgi:hypothetical protein
LRVSDVCPEKNLETHFMRISAKAGGERRPRKIGDFPLFLSPSVLSLEFPFGFPSSPDFFLSDLHLIHPFYLFFQGFLT